MGVWPLGPYVSRKRLFSTVPGGTEQISTLSFGSGSLLTSNLSWATDGSLESTWQVGRYEVDGSEIRRSPVDTVGSLSTIIYKVLDYIPGGCLEFLNHQQYEDGDEWPDTGRKVSGHFGRYLFFGGVPRTEESEYMYTYIYIYK